MNKKVCLDTKESKLISSVLLIVNRLILTVLKNTVVNLHGNESFRITKIIHFSESVGDNNSELNKHKTFRY